jgi:hypothetical protein
MNKMFLNLLLGCSVLFTIAGCGDSKPPGDGYGDVPNPMDSQYPFDPRQIDLKCAQGVNCPASQGVLVSIRRYNTESFYEVEHHIEIMRCTGSVYGLHSVITAGHCIRDMAGADQIYFKTVDRPDSPGRLFHVSRPLVSQKTDDEWASDYGAFELAEPATSISFVHPALQVPTPFNKITALVVNAPAGQDVSNLELDALACENRADEIDPVTYDQNPTTFVVTVCKLVSGNSGGVLVDPNDWSSVLGIAQASNKAGDSRGNIPSFLQVPNGFQSTGPSEPIGIVANARCFTLPGWPRAENNCREMNSAVMKAESVKYRAGKMMDQVIRATREWAKQRPSTLEISGGPRILAGPIPVPYSKMLSFLGKPKIGLVMLPMPLCVEQPSNAQSFEYRTELTAYDTRSEDGSTSLSEAYDTFINAKLRFQRSDTSGPSYLVQYSIDSMAVEIGQNEASQRMLNELKSGKNMDIPPCKGNEMATYLDNLEKGIREAVKKQGESQP